MRISDWSSDVCSSDLAPVAHEQPLALSGDPVVAALGIVCAELGAPEIDLLVDHRGSPSSERLEAQRALVERRVACRWRRVGRLDVEVAGLLGQGRVVGVAVDGWTPPLAHRTTPAAAHGDP